METEYWEISDYRKTQINLFEEGEKIYSSKLTKKQVEEKLGFNLNVAG